MSHTSHIRLFTNIMLVNETRLESLKIMWLNFSININYPQLKLMNVNIPFKHLLIL